MTQLTCPACASPSKLKHKKVIFLACPNCHYCLQQTAKEILVLNQTPAIPNKERSRFNVGDAGSLRGRKFEVIGHIYFYEIGEDPLTTYWEEWVVIFEDNTVGYIEDDMGNLAYSSEKVDISVDRETLDQVQVNSTIKVDHFPIHVEEKGQGSVLSVEGQFFYKILPGRTFHYIDALMYNYLVSIEYGDEISPHLYYGTKIDIADIKNDRLLG